MHIEGRGGGGVVVWNVVLIRVCFVDCLFEVRRNGRRACFADLLDEFAVVLDGVRVLMVGLMLWY